jgi:glycosyltransferase involved in cell wall biosynthesis
MMNSKIKIAQVITRLDWGGSPDIFRILCSHLDPNLYDITLIIGDTKHPTQKTSEFLKRFKGRTVMVPQLKRDISPVDDIAAFWKLYSIFRKGHFDIVHTHTAKAGALGRLAAALGRTPVIVHTPHGHNLYGYFNKRASAIIVRIEKFLTRFTDEIIALTELERSDYASSGVAAAGKVSVIYQGLELDKLVRDWKSACSLKNIFKIGPDTRVVGMVGRLEPVKGSPVFIEAAARVAKLCPNTKFIIAGEGSLKAAMEKRALELGIGGVTIFAGWRDDIPDIISLMDVMVLPSLNEAVGIALIEAQAEGVPVVASKVGGIPEVVNDRKTGILVPPSDPAAIADAVVSLLSDKAKCAAMGEAGKIWVRGRFRAEDMAEKTSALYMRLLNKKRYRIA